MIGASLLLFWALGNSSDGFIFLPVCSASSLIVARPIGLYLPVLPMFLRVVDFFCMLESFFCSLKEF